MLTHDTAIRTVDAAGNMLGKPLGGAFRMADYDGANGKRVTNRTCDSTGVFFINELNRLDPTFHGPLAAVTWHRDTTLREDVTVADEISSYTVTTFASSSGLGGDTPTLAGGKSWMGKTTTQVAGVSVDLALITHALRPWALELKYDILELESAARAGRPIDQQKWAAIQMKHEMDVDAMVFYGDASMSEYGLVNSDSRSGLDQVTAQNFPAGASGYTSWFQKSADEILADFNTGLTTVWQSAAWSVVPMDILIPTDRYGYIATAKVSQAGTDSILKYIEENNLAARAGRGKVNIREQKWCNGAGVGGTLGNTSTVNRMVVYTNEHERTRFPMTTIQSTPVQYDGMYQKKTYFCRLGVQEIVYPETIGYFDGL